VQGLEVALAVVGTCALLLGAGLAGWRASMLLGWKKRTGSVVSYLHQRAYRGSAFRRIVVRLTGEDGAVVEASDEGIWNRYGEGQTVALLVVPGSHPPRVVVPEFLRFWMMSLIFVPFGAAFLYAAFVYLPGLG
jgi:hypothetical protein